MTRPLLLSLAQINPVVGDVRANAVKIRQTMAVAQQQQADILVLPELALTGYPPEDLLLRPELIDRVEAELQALTAESGDLALVIGHPARQGSYLFNRASVLRQGKVLASYDKQCLPNYAVFDEQRYFTAGSQPVVFELQGVRIGLLICEDLWQAEPMAQLQAAQAQLVLSLNASPYSQGHSERRRQQILKRYQQCPLPLVYVNQVGGQDELVFDGQSLVWDAQGAIQVAPAFEESQPLVGFSLQAGFDVRPVGALPSVEAELYAALVLGVKDYVGKNGFPGALLGLSGGIDSALTLAIAVDALGAEQVMAVMMPFHYTADISIVDAAEQARRLNVEYRQLPIASIYDAAMQQLQPLFAGTSPDTTEENLQARCRGLLLMALSNKTGRIVLTTGNKSELAVGYATLYGDMAGGFDVLKDVPKTLVYRLSAWRNAQSPVIPQRVIDRPPSAELAPGQVDQDSLPPYDMLDAILERFVEQDMSVADIVAEGFEPQVVARIARLVELNEHKRRQAAPGVRVSQRAFGRDRRYPITSGFRRG